MSVHEMQILGPGPCCGCVLVCVLFRAEHVYTGLCRQQLQPARDPDQSGQPGQQRPELGRVLREAPGGSHGSALLHCEISRLTTARWISSFSDEHLHRCTLTLGTPVFDFHVGLVRLLFV